MKRILLSFFIGATTPLLIGFLFVKLGGMPVATKAPPLPLERFLAMTAIHAAMKNDVDRESPVPIDESSLRAGAKVYGAHCAVCHGLPGKPLTIIGKGMFPRPPLLLPPEKGVTDDSVGETYWKVKNGIRLTGMPAFADGLSDDEIWKVSLFLQRADHLPEGMLESVGR